ncbi:MAG: hypothetical protein OEW75_18945, partial [Cyclobacteriaceae bacterium]|nr:hypothetical protein [Cyclobacteriaceae bacterium]
MRNFIVLLFLFSFIFPNQLFSQNPNETTYMVFDYMKIEPGKDQDYLELERAWKKINKAKVTEGILADWSLYKAVSPSGNLSEYNYITVNLLKGEKKLASYLEGNDMPKNWQSLVTKKELELVNKTVEIRVKVKSEVWYYVDGYFEKDWTKNSNVFVLNYMKTKPGRSVSEHTQVERDIWLPVHEARVKGKSMTGWGVYNMMLPFGSEREYQCATLDAYLDMEQFLTSEYAKYFAQVYPDQDLNELFSRTAEVVEINKG